MFNVSLDRFSYGPKDSQDTIVPKAERRPYLHRSKAEIEMLQRIDPDWREEDDE